MKVNFKRAGVEVRGPSANGRYLVVAGSTRAWVTREDLDSLIHELEEFERARMQSRVARIT